MAIPYEASSNLDGFRDGFQRVPRQATFGNSCWGLGPRHFYNGFRTGSGRVPTGSEAVHFSKFVLAPRPQALLRRVPDGFRRVPTPGTFTTGSGWVPTGSDPVHSSYFVLASQTNVTSAMSSESLEARGPQSNIAGRDEFASVHRRE